MVCASRFPLQPALLRYCVNVTEDFLTNLKIKGMRDDRKRAELSFLYSTEGEHTQSISP